ncbi:hypothetical protein [Amnibacterium endophyticum]|uniref:FlgD Ig-like domain-containing protein n=1 Tax=Amnibacterium endophyticum TaxID=2109337 RepID=A0ABW4LCC6_9MICO
MVGRPERATGAIAATVLAFGLALLTAVPAEAAPTPSPSATPAAAPQRWPAGTGLSTAVLGEAVLTLPARDGLRDSVPLRVRSGQEGRVEVVAHRGARDVPISTVALKRTGAGWQRTVRVPVGKLTEGRWRLEARRVAEPAVRSRTSVLVGSGEPVSVAIKPVARTVYPYRDGVLDAVDATVVATDETGAALPVRGALRLDVGARHRTRTLHGGRARIPVTTMPFGSGRLSAAVRGPAGAAKRTTTVALAPTGVGALRLARSADTVQPVVDGLLDAVTLTTSGTASGGSSAKVTGRLTIEGRSGVVRSWKVPDGAARRFVWDGRVQGAIVPGIYTVTLRLRGPEGPTTTRTRTLTVSKDHLPYRVRDLFAVAAGNQQGLAVHDGLFYVATDVGSGSSRIDVYDGRGTIVRTLGVLPIGHGAALSFSTTTGQLYAANGGPTSPTTVYELDPGATDPALAVKRTVGDLTILGPNGMVAVDDAGGRLLVFAGTKGAYTLSSVGFDGTIQRTASISISGLPQGLQMIDGELWVYTSLRGRNRIARFAVTDGAVVAAGTGTAAFDLMNPGEGEGLAFSDGSTYVGAHGGNRVGVLELVADE